MATLNKLASVLVKFKTNKTQSVYKHTSHATKAPGISFFDPKKWERSHRNRPLSSGSFTKISIEPRVHL